MGAVDPEKQAKMDEKKPGSKPGLFVRQSSVGLVAGGAGCTEAGFRTELLSRI